MGCLNMVKKKEDTCDGVTLKDAQDMKRLLNSGSLKHGILALNEWNPSLAKTLLDAAGLEIKKDYNQILTRATKTAIKIICMSCLGVTTIYSMLTSLWVQEVLLGVELSTQLLYITILAICGMLYLFAIAIDYTFRWAKK